MQFKKGTTKKQRRKITQKIQRWSTKSKRKSWNEYFKDRFDVVLTREEVHWFRKLARNKKGAVKCPEEIRLRYESFPQVPKKVAR